MLFASSTAHSDSAPPLKPNEQIVKTKDGCGFVVDTSSASAAYETEAKSKLIWGGPCVDGLAMGEGWISEGDYRYVDIPPLRGWVWYGRIFGAYESRVGGGTSSSTFIWDGKHVSYNTLSTAMPVWGKQHNERSRVSDGNTLVMTNTRGCILEAKTIPECRQENKFDIPGVMVLDLKTKRNSQHNCPDPRSTQGCDALWAEHAGPVIERIKAFVAENEPKVEARKREIAPLIANWRPSPNAKQEDAARHAALRTTQLAEREQREAKNAADREKHKREMEKLDAEIAAQRAENERLRVISEQERKERNRRDQQEALGVLRTHAETSAALGNRKPAKQLATLEILAGNTPQEILAILKSGLAEAIARNPALARTLAVINSPQEMTAQDALAIMRPALNDAARRNPNVASKLAILEALTANSPQDAMNILTPMLIEAVNKYPKVGR